MSIRVGIVGISGFGGGEAMRLVASHPSFELIYAAGEGSAGSRLVDRFPGVSAKLAELVIEKWDPVTLPKLDVLFAVAAHGRLGRGAGARPQGREDRRHRRRPPLVWGVRPRAAAAAAGGPGPHVRRPMTTGPMGVADNLGKRRHGAGETDSPARNRGLDGVPVWP